MKTETLLLPSYAASFLINGDDSSLDRQTKKEIVDFIYENDLRLQNCLTCSEQSQIGRWQGKICEMLEFVFAVKK